MEKITAEFIVSQIGKLSEKELIALIEYFGDFRWADGQDNINQNNNR